MVPLNRLPKGNVLDEWYPLLPSSHAKVEIGSVRVKSKFTVRNVEVYPGYHVPRAAGIFGVGRHIFSALEKSLAPRIVKVVLCIYRYMFGRARKLSGTQGSREKCFVCIMLQANQ